MSGNLGQKWSTPNSSEKYRGEGTENIVEASTY